MARNTLKGGTGAYVECGNLLPLWAMTGDFNRRWTRRHADCVDGRGRSKRDNREEARKGTKGGVAGGRVFASGSVDRARLNMPRGVTVQGAHVNAPCRQCDYRRLKSRQQEHEIPRRGLWP
jgi:hypothetical protein